MYECEQHYDSSLEAPHVDKYGLTHYIFQKGPYEINAGFLDGKVVRISYTPPYGTSISEGQIDTLLNANKDGDETWTYEGLSEDQKFVNFSGTVLLPCTAQTVTVTCSSTPRRMKTSWRPKIGKLRRIYN
jgi:hypothetical protein